MKNILKLPMTLLTLIVISCKIKQQKLEYLQNKYFLKISPKNLKTSQQTIKSQNTIKYSFLKIIYILKKYNFPFKYNFFNSTGAKKNVKNQKDCGSCWSFASTSALAYRFYKQKGIDVDLSPQNGLSCYIRNCSAGDYDIDAALHLVKNGTVTEKCFPYKSVNNSIMPDCPKTCEDGSEYKKYYAQKAYTTSIIGKTQENFYDIITIIFDQLVNYGPVVTGIHIYEDFKKWKLDNIKCKTEVYTYDGISNFSGGHSAVIVGYGRKGFKYYWLLQNSWGSDFCDNGFFRVEMGQIGVESVIFFEPYLPNEKALKKKVDLEFKSIDKDYSMQVNTTNYKDWENTVEFSFKNSNCSNDRPLNMQCCKVSTPIFKIPLSVCYFETKNFEMLHEGKYEFKNFKSLGTENDFYLDNSFANLSFNFKGEKCPQSSKFLTWLIVLIVIAAFVLLVILIISIILKKKGCCSTDINSTDIDYFGV